MAVEPVAQRLDGETPATEEHLRRVAGAVRRHDHVVELAQDVVQRRGLGLVDVQVGAEPLLLHLGPERVVVHQCRPRGVEEQRAAMRRIEQILGEC